MPGCKSKQTDLKKQGASPWHVCFEFALMRADGYVCDSIVDVDCDVNVW